MRLNFEFSNTEREWIPNGTEFRMEMNTELNLTLNLVMNSKECSTFMKWVLRSKYVNFTTVSLGILH